MFGSRKYPYPPRGWPLEILKGWGSQKSNVLKQSIKLNWNFRREWGGGGGTTKNHPCTQGGGKIFLGKTTIMKIAPRSFRSRG